MEAVPYRRVLLAARGGRGGGAQERLADNSAVFRWYAAVIALFSADVFRVKPKVFQKVGKFGCEKIAGNKGKPSAGDAHRKRRRPAGSFSLPRLRGRAGWGHAGLTALVWRRGRPQKTR